MELWIRSQDRMKLCNAKVFSLDNDQTGIFCNSCEDSYVFAGKYKTKERALEVLDEIQNILKPKMIVNTYKVEQAELCDGTQFIQPMLDDIQVQNATTYVYEMPKE